MLGMAAEMSSPGGGAGGTPKGLQRAACTPAALVTPHTAPHRGRHLSGRTPQLGFGFGGALALGCAGFGFALALGCAGLALHCLA